MQFHEFANLYPLMQGAEFDDLCASIKKSGLLHEITLFEDKILDGRNRYNACIQAGITPKYKHYNGLTTPDGLLDYVRNENEQRRHLNGGQLAVIGISADELLQRLFAEAKERQKAHGNQYVSIEKTTSAVVQKVAQPNGEKTRDKLAKMFNTNRQYIQDAFKIKAERPDLLEKVKEGEITIQEAKREIKKDEKEKTLSIVNSIKDQDNKYIKEINNGWHKIGKHYLYCGSNLDDEFINFLPYADFVFADPPYNAGVAEWDKEFKWQHDLFIDKGKVFAVTPGGWNAFNFYKETNMPYLWEMACWINNGMTHGLCGFANFIKVAIFAKDKVKIPQDFFQVSIKVSETDETDHKGRKPYPFMAELINLFAPSGGCVVDIFAGSGTTLLVAEKLGRISYNAEIDKNFCINIINRCIENGLQYERL